MARASVSAVKVEERGMVTEGQSLVERGVEQIVVRVLERMGYFDTAEAKECRRRLSLIYAKDFLKPAEAAYLLGCSDNHLRNLVKKAKRGETKRPIPFVDLDGTVSFPRQALLEWAGQPKATLKVVKEGEAA